jgi:hypothetical protein
MDPGTRDERVDSSLFVMSVTISALSQSCVLAPSDSKDEFAAVRADLRNTDGRVQTLDGRVQCWMRR